MTTRRTPRQLTQVLTVVLSSAMAIIPPAVTYSVEARSEVSILRVEAQISAKVITQLVSENPQAWTTLSERLGQILKQRPSSNTPEIRALFDRQGHNVARSADSLQGPFFLTVASDVFDSGQAVGVLKITRSQFDLLMDSALMGLFSTLLGLGFYAYMRMKPLRALAEAEKELYSLATFDSLTGLYNRLTLQHIVEQLLNETSRRKETLGVLFLDLDRFKQTNDTLGQDIGDKLLVEVARRLRLCVRASDIVARLGGDEFVLILTGTNGAKALAMVADDVLNSLAQPYQLPGGVVHSSASIGIAIFPYDGKGRDELMVRADQAMYQAKALGKNRYQFYSAEVTQDNTDRITLDNELRRALADDQFVLHYQPQVDLNTGRVCGVEALVRWQHPQRGLVHPDYFIRPAEENGLILPLGDWVIRTACRQLMQWRAAGLPDMAMSVNVSPIQFEARDFVDKLKSALEDSRLDPALLELEITEGILLKKPQEVLDRFHMLRKIGVLLAIDDFGTGYSSLSYLTELPVSRLKLDVAFVRTVDKDEKSRAICAATIRLAATLGLDVVAEGVETQAQLDSLKMLRCDSVQGYYFCEPLPVDEAFQYILHRNSLPNITEHKSLRRTVMIVDDDPLIGDFLKIMVESYGHQARVFHNPVDALNRIKVDVDHFDLILVDLLMPNMSGLDLLRVIREYSRTIPIAIITSYDTRELWKFMEPIAAELNYRNGENFFFLQKPVHQHEIMMLLEQVWRVDLSASHEPGEQEANRAYP